MASSLLSPRFESDKEDGPDKKEHKKVVDGTLAHLATWDAKGVDVDKRMLEGRKANRGFTMSVGSKAEDVDIAALRSGKRAQTLPASNTRRGDLELDEEAINKMKEQQAMLTARFRRGSQSLSFMVVPDEELDRVWQEICTCHTHGKMTEGQAHGDERERHFTNESAKLPTDVVNPVPIIACQKGSKGFRDTTPNQDNYSITYFKNGWTLACTFDGHGPNGHIVSTRTVQTVPYFLANSEAFPDSMGDALIEAFEKAQKDLVGHALQHGWDVQASGSTAVAACWKGTQVWTANAGDSRCVIGTEDERQVVFETEDHKPTTPGEKARIESMGGEVRSQTYPDGWVNHRIFIKGESFPGLCMARTFGDESVKNHGVVATPEVAMTTIDLSKKPFFILASDGVWEFIDSHFAIKAVAKKIQTDGPAKTLEKLQREAKKRWKQEEGDYCDDITSILVQLR